MEREEATRTRSAENEIGLGLASGRPELVTTANGREVAKRLRKKVRMLFWAELIASATVNLAGIVLPTLAAVFTFSQGRAYAVFKDTQLIPPMACTFAVVAIFGLTAGNTSHGPKQRLSWTLRLLIIGEFALRWIVAAPSLGLGTKPGVSFWIVRHILYEILVIGLFVAIGTIMRSFSCHRVARSAVRVGFAVAVVDVVTMFGSGAMRAWTSVPTSFVRNIGLGLELVVAVCAFMLLWKVQNVLGRIVGLRCIECGYSLEGLSAPRCPECGTDFHSGRVHKQVNLDDLSQQ